jgi:superfamily II DNA or RNA helicase
VRELSGDTPFDDVRVTLDHLERSGPTDGVIATSMVSHGVDIDRLNVMVFNGMPKSMAEYIQASSRVGRRFLGVVFMIFNPVRERDRSHFRYHGKFHEYLDRMVEPVAINRWSRYAALKTLPGVLMADVLQVANRDYWDAGSAPAHLHDLSRMQAALRPLDAGGLESVRPEAILEALNEAYLAERDEAAELRPELDARVHAAVTSIRAAGAAASASLGGRPRYRGTADYLGLEYTPMTSLRDIDEGIPFYVLPERRRRP